MTIASNSRTDVSRRTMLKGAAAAGAVIAASTPTILRAADPTTLVISMQADPTGFDPEAVLNNSSGFIMAMFLAGLRGIDSEILKAAQIDGASAVQTYRRIVIPQLRPAFLSAFVVLAHLAIKSYDLIIAMTNGGPGRSTEMPSTFMYSYTFTRSQMNVGAASAVVMLMMISAIIIPYIYTEVRGEPR